MKKVILAKDRRSFMHYCEVHKLNPSEVIFLDRPEKLHGLLEFELIEADEEVWRWTSWPIKDMIATFIHRGETYEKA